MILAAGRGERMQPLTNKTPKPLLKVGGRPLIEYHLHRLARAGVKEVVINIAYLGHQIRDYLGDSFSPDACESVTDHWGSESLGNEPCRLAISYSEEPEPLETAGAILHALPLLGDSPFLLVNGDIWTDYPFETLLNNQPYNGLEQQNLAHVVLVNNPEHNLEGDFSLSDNEAAINNERRLLNKRSEKNYTFSGISVINPKLLMDYPNKREKFPLAEVLRFGIEHQQISAEVYAGQWRDIGTVERLKSLDSYLKDGLAQ